MYIYIHIHACLRICIALGGFPKWELPDLLPMAGLLNPLAWDLVIKLMANKSHSWKRLPGDGDPGRTFQ